MGFLNGGWASSALEVAEFLIHCIFIVQAELCEDLFVLGLNNPESEYDQLKSISFLLYYIYFFLITCFLFVFLFLFSIHNLISFGHLLFLFHFFGFTNFLRHKASYTQTHLTGKGPSWEDEWTISFSACCTHKCIIQLLNAEEGREEHICMYAFFIWLQELNVYALSCLKDKGCVS